MAIQTQRFLNSRVRWIVFAAIVILSVYLLAVTPVRTYFDQRAQIQATQDRYHLLADANAQMTQRVQQLQSDAEIARLARERYELVPPGADAYAVMPAPSQPAPAPPREKQGFWSKVWDGLSFWN